MNKMKHGTYPLENLNAAMLDVTSAVKISKLPDLIVTIIGGDRFAASEYCKEKKDVKMLNTLINNEDENERLLKMLLDNLSGIDR